LYAGHEDEEDKYMPEDGEEEAEHCDMPAGCISKSVSTKTT